MRPLLSVAVADLGLAASRWRSSCMDVRTSPLIAALHAASAAIPVGSSILHTQSREGSKHAWASLVTKQSLGLCAARSNASGYADNDSMRCLACYLMNNCQRLQRSWTAQPVVHPLALPPEDRPWTLEHKQTKGFPHLSASVGSEGGHGPAHCETGAPLQLNDWKKVGEDRR